jgi:predicted nucleic-acid-binding Zn-ribbon protein
MDDTPKRAETGRERRDRLRRELEAMSPEERTAFSERQRAEAEERRLEAQRKKEQVERERIELKALRREKAAELIPAKWVGEQLCPICGVRNWTVLDIAETRIYTGPGQSMSDRVYPVAPVACLNCGYMVFFNAGMLGLLDLELPKPAEEEPPADEAATS